MDNIKIVFFDIDGTLIDIHSKNISEKMLEALIRLKENKIILCIATGRAPISVPNFEGVKFDTFITFNGAYCFDKNNTILNNPIPAHDVKKILQNAESIDKAACIATIKRLAANGREKNLEEYFSFAKIELEVAEDFEELTKEEVYQIMIGCEEAEYPKILKDVHHARITSWWDRAVDIIPFDVSKGTAVERVLEYYHLDKTQALAFGDGNNDIEMLKAVGTGVAMGNASQQLKEIADDVCGQASEDGIYHYCVEHGLI